MDPRIFWIYMMLGFIRLSHEGLNARVDMISPSQSNNSLGSYWELPGNSIPTTPRHHNALRINSQADYRIPSFRDRRDQIPSKIGNNDSDNESILLITSRVPDDQPLASKAEEDLLGRKFASNGFLRGFKEFSSKERRSLEQLATPHRLLNSRLAVSRKIIFSESINNQTDESLIRKTKSGKKRKTKGESRMHGRLSSGSPDASPKAADGRREDMEETLGENNTDISETARNPRTRKKQKKTNIYFPGFLKNGGETRNFEERSQAPTVPMTAAEKADWGKNTEINQVDQKQRVRGEPAEEAFTDSANLKPINSIVKGENKHSETNNAGQTGKEATVKAGNEMPRNPADTLKNTEDNNGELKSVPTSKIETTHLTKEEEITASMIPGQDSSTTELWNVNQYLNMQEGYATKHSLLRTDVHTEGQDDCATKRNVTNDDVSAGNEVDLVNDLREEDNGKERQRKESLLEFNVEQTVLLDRHNSETNNKEKNKGALVPRNYGSYGSGGGYGYSPPVQSYTSHHSTDISSILLALIPICLALGAAVAFTLASIGSGSSNSTSSGGSQQQQQQQQQIVYPNNIIPYIIINGTIIPIVGRSNRGPFSSSFKLQPSITKLKHTWAKKKWRPPNSRP